MTGIWNMNVPMKMVHLFPFKNLPNETLVKYWLIYSGN